VHQLRYLASHSFWTVWLILTGVLLAIAGCFLRGPEVTTTRWNIPAPSRAGVVSSILLFLFLGGYIAMVLIGEDFATYDNSQFTAYSLRGIDFPVWVLPEGGRFYPLALQQFNLIGHLTGSIAGYHLFQILEMLAVTAILLVLDEQLSFAARSVLAVIALSLPSMVISFTGLIYQESDVVFWLAGLVLSVRFYARTRSTWWGVLAVLCGQFALYYKEPVFVFLLTFTGVRVLLRARSSGRFSEVLWNHETRLDLCLALSSLIFAAYYGIVIFPGTNLQYLASRHLSPGETILEYLRLDWLVCIFSGFTIWRFYRVFRGAAPPELIWDGLAAGGLAYFAAYLAMGLTSEYFLAPVDLIAVLYLGRYVYLSWKAVKPRFRAAAAVLSLLVVCNNLDNSTYRVLQRKWTIKEKQRITGAILERYRSDPQHPIKLYFPVTSEYNMAEYAAYLNYRGLTVEEDPPRSGQRPRVELYGANIRRDGPCVRWLPFVCHAGAEVLERITVILPEDAFSSTGFNAYRQAEERLLPQKQGPSQPDLLFGAVQLFRPGAFAF
jgi:hypothetical protein